MNINADDSRQRLLTAALDIFTQKGYAATSVSEIVSAAGVTKPMLYYYFKNKEGIYTELMNYAFAQFQSLIARHIDSQENVYIKIRDLFIDMMELHNREAKYAKLLYALVYGPAEGAPATDYEVYHTALVEILNVMITKGIDSGEIESVDADDLSTMLIAILFFCMETNVIKCSKQMSVDDMVRIITKIFDKIIIK